MQKVNKTSRYKLIALSILTGLLICYYVISRAFPMLIPTEAVYGSYYFPRVFWVTASIMAFISIKNRKVDLHKDWMIRSYVITLAFVSFRFVEDILNTLEIGTQIEILALMSWTCWAIPLFIAEVFIQGRKIKNRTTK